MPPTSQFQVDDEALKVYGDMKLGSKDTRFITLSVNKSSGIIKLEKCFKKTENQEADYKEMLGNLCDESCLFIILDMSVESKTGATKDQLFIITWAPDSSTVHQKMLYSTAKTSLESALNAGEGCRKLQANDWDDLTYKELCFLKNKD